jgi:hypothetical protein
VSPELLRGQRIMIASGALADVPRHTNPPTGLPATRHCCTLMVAVEFA